MQFEIVMKMTSYFTLIFSLLVTITAAGQSPSIDAELKKALQEISGRDSSLLTPPYGTISVDVQKARAEITKIYTELGGADLKSFDGHWVVNIYADPAPSAWVKKLFHQERTWNRIAGKTVSYRDAMKLASDGKPIYEFGFSVGLLRTLKTKDQLAFVIGHELTHLLEGHLDGETGRVSSQQHELVADVNGLRRMVGRYDLTAAAGALAAVYGVAKKGERGGCLYDLIISGVADHHHEGQRISSLQFAAEHYLRTEDRAQRVRTSSKLAEYYKNILPRSRRIREDTAFVEWEVYYEKVVRSLFLNKQLLNSMLNQGSIDLNDDRPSNLAYPTQDQIEQFTNKLMEILETSPASKVEKVNSFLQVMSLISVKPEHFLAMSISAELRHRIYSFLLSNSAGSGAWTSADYMRIDALLKPEYRIGLNSFLLGLKQSEGLLVKLAVVSAEWNRLAQSLADKSRFYGAQGKLDTWALRADLRRAESVSESYLSQMYLRNLAESFKKNKWKNPQEQSEVLAALNDTFNHGRDRKLRVQPVLDVLRVGEKGLGSQRITEIEAKFSQLNYKDKLNLIFSLSATDRREYSVNDFSRLNHLLLDMARNPELDPNVWGSFSGVTALSVSYALADTTISFKERKDLFHMLISHQRQAADHDGGPEFEKNLSLFFESLSNSQRLQLLTETPKNLSRQQEKILSTVKGQDTTDYEKVYELLSKMSPDGSGYNIFSEVKSRLASLKVNVFRLFYQGGQLPFISNTLSPKEANLVFESIMRTEQELLILERLTPSGATRVRHRQASAAFVALFIRTLHPDLPFSQFQERWGLLRKLTGEEYSMDEKSRLVFDKYIEKFLKELPVERKYELIRDAHVRSFLEEQQMSDILLENLSRKVHVGSSLESLSVAVRKVVEDHQLLEKQDLFILFRNEVAEKWNLQTNSIQQVFPQDLRSDTQKTAAFRLQIRGLSTVLAATRGHPFVEQMKMIDYLMGRRSQWPSFINKIELDLQQSRVNSGMGASFTSHLKDLRDNMQNRTEIERSAVVNAFLTGPTGLIQDPNNLAAVSEEILSVVSSENRDIARVMMQALYQAEGVNKSLFLSYILAQKSSKRVLSEALVLKSILDAYGVPGVKLAQYLSFTDEFKSFHSTLQSYQDAALPLSYFEVLELIKIRLDKKWNPEKFQILRILGTGSVNVAVEYLDLEMGTKNVINLSRRDITTKTREDFHRFNLLLKALGADPIHGRKFGFVAGLMKIVNDSVSLEFDKRHAFDIQREVQALYNRNVNGWKVRTVKAYQLEDMSIFMQKAPGVGARHILASDPAAYRSAMGALLAVEDAVLRGVGADSASSPIPLHANPDLHDGQVLIDTKEKTVTLLDFGQAERISNAERELGIEMLRFVSGIDSAKAAKSTFTSRFASMNIKGGPISVEFLTEVLSRPDRMDRFVRLASGLHQRGYEVPLSSIHWVLAVNRIVKLGEKIGVPMEKSYRNLLLTTKVGLSLRTYNRAASWVRPVPKAQIEKEAPSCRAVFAM